MQHPSLLDTAAALPHVAGSPGLEVLRRLRPAPDRSAVDAPSHDSLLAADHGARSGTVPVFTVVRSMKEEPDCVPAASPRVRRRLSSWPPGQLLYTGPGVGRSPETMTCIRTASGPDPPGSSRCPFERRKTPVPRVLLSITLAGPAPSGSTGHVPALSGPLSPSPSSPGSGCPQLQPRCCDSEQVQVFHLHSNQQRLTAQTKFGPDPSVDPHASPGGQYSPAADIRLKAGNGEIVATGEGYSSKSAVRQGCQAVQRAAAGAEIIEAAPTGT